MSSRTSSSSTFPQRLIVSAAASLAGFALLGWLSAQDWFYTALGVDQPGSSAALLLFILVLPAFTWILTPLGAAWSRRHEFQADAFAARFSDGPELGRALVRLYRENASTPDARPVAFGFLRLAPAASRPDCTARQSRWRAICPCRRAGYLVHVSTRRRSERPSSRSGSSPSRRR